MIEFTPHHLWFCNEDVDTSKGLYKCFPPIKSIDDRNALRFFLKNNTYNPLVSIGSDTAPHPVEAKNSENPPGGLASLQHIIPVMLSLKNILKLSDKDIENLTSNNIGNFLGIHIPQKYTTWEKKYWGPDKTSYNNGNVLNPFKDEILKGKFIKGD